MHILLVFEVKLFQEQVCTLCFNRNKSEFLIFGAHTYLQFKIIISNSYGVILNQLILSYFLYLETLNRSQCTYHLPIPSHIEFNVQHVEAQHIYIYQHCHKVIHALHVIHNTYIVFISNSNIFHWLSHLKMSLCFFNCFLDFTNNEIKLKFNFFVHGFMVIFLHILSASIQTTCVWNPFITISSFIIVSFMIKMYVCERTRRFL